MTLAEAAAYLPGLISGPAGAGLMLAFWKHRERSRAQTDETALSLVQTQGKRIDTLEGWVRDLQHRLSNTEAEKRSLFWLLKYCPEERRQEAVADVERQMREAEELRAARADGLSASDIHDLKGEVRQAAQVARSAKNIVADEANG